MALLECPLCTFAVLPSDDYVLQLHFEQEHTEDSPFRIQDDPEPLPKPPPAKASSASTQHVDTDTPSSFDDENNVLCPEPNCGELVLLSDFNDHLDLHAAETLSFDEATGKYRTQQPPDIHKQQQPLDDSIIDTTSSIMGTSKEPSFLEQGFHSSSAAPPTGPRRSGDDGRRLKKKSRARGNSSASEKSTLSRSIAAFNPFSKAKAKPVHETARLGVRISLSSSCLRTDRITACRARPSRLGRAHAPLAARPTQGRPQDHRRQPHRPRRPSHQTGSRSE